MQNNLRNRSVALASTFALVLSGLVAAAPAAYAANPVVLAPTAGTNLGAFITDDFEMDIDVPAPNAATSLAIDVKNPSEEIVKFVLSTSGTVSAVSLRAFGATGAEVTIDDDDLVGASVSATATRTTNGKQIDLGNNNTLIFNFGDSDVTRLVIFDLETAVGALIDDSTVKLGLQLMKTTVANFAWGDTNQGDITVQAWVESEATKDYETIDSATASAAATVKFYDPAGVSVIPSIERFVDTSGNQFANGADDLTNDGVTGVAGRVQFVRPDLNLSQVDLTNWELSVRDTSGNVVQAAAGLNSLAVNLAGMGTNKDRGGAVYFNQPSDALSSSSSYTVRVAHTDNNVLNTRTFNSAGFTPATNDTNRTLFLTVTDSTNAQQTGAVAPSTADANGTTVETISLRPGTESFTYKARLYDTDGTDREKDASVTVIAIVTAGSFMPTGTSLSVSGSNQTLSRAGASTVVAGLTNSDGDFNVTVTSSNPVAATSYTVEFKSLTADGKWTNAFTDTAAGTANKLTATYAAADVDSTALTIANSVLAGESVTVSATVEDTYGVATNLDGTKALYLTVQGTDTADLDETVAVAADGTASVTFDNYVLSGESDLLNVFLHTGATYAAANQLDSEVVSLYNPGAVAAVNAPASVTGNITYDDFIVGTASSTNVAPNDNSMTITGTVVDTNGSGIPGAVVTISAPGMQLRQTGAGAYAQGTISFAASASGVYSVDVWSHVVNATGVGVTITSGGKSATTTVKTYLPTGLSGGNLVFSIDAPTNIDVNKTYAIQASLTDKWGNPVKTSGDSVDIVGIGSVEINSAAAGATGKNFGADGKVTVFVRSIKDIEGPGTITATLQTGAVYSTSATATATVDRTEVLVDVAGTVHDETSFSNEIEFSINVGEAAASSSEQKVNAGSFKGYVAVYARGYEGQRLSAKIGKDWVIVDPIVNNQENGTLFRTVDFTGAGVNIAVRIYIDRVLVDTINLTTK